MADRTLARFPLTDADGRTTATSVAAIFKDRPATWEETPFGGLSAVFYWRSPDVALSVAMSNAGWGHRNARLAAQAAQDTAVRIERANRDQGVTS